MISIVILSGILLIPINIYDAKANPCADSTSTVVQLVELVETQELRVVKHLVLLLTLGFRDTMEAMVIRVEAMVIRGLEAMVIRVEAMVIRVEAMVIRVEAMVIRVEAMVLRVEAMVIRVEAMVLRVEAVMLVPAPVELVGTKETVVLVVLAGLPEMLVLVQLVDQEQVY